MRIIRRVVCLLLLAGLIFGSHRFAPASCEVATVGNLITTNPTAPGTKLFGPLTMYHDVFEDQTCALGLRLRKMFFFTRLSKGFELFPFSGSSEFLTTQQITDKKGNIITITNFKCLEDVSPSEQQQAIEGLVAAQLIPVIFPNNPTAPFAIKSVNNLVQDDQLHFPLSPFFEIMDVEIAVKE